MIEVEQVVPEIEDQYEHYISVFKDAKKIYAIDVADANHAGILFGIELERKKIAKLVEALRKYKESDDLFIAEFGKENLLSGEIAKEALENLAKKGIK